MNTIQNKITELLFLLNQSQVNSDIPNVKLEADPEIKQRIAEAKKAELGIDDPAKKGMLMGAIIKELAGKADGSDVKAVVDSLFS